MVLMEDSTAAWLTAMLCVIIAAAATFLWEYLHRPRPLAPSATHCPSSTPLSFSSASPHGIGQYSISASRKYRQEGEPGFDLAVLGLVPCKLPNGELKELGRGASGRVIQARLDGGQDVAVKIVHLTAEQVNRGLPRDVADMQKRLRHPSLVHGHSAYLQSKTLILVSELMKGGTLRQAITQDKLGSLHWHALGCQIALDIAQGLAYLHSLDIMHAHLKSNSNVLLTKAGRAKLGDVGVASLVEASLSVSFGRRGGVAWAAPELVLGERCTTKVDCFSLGVLFWEIVTQEVPLRGKMRPPQVPAECPQEVADIIAECLQINAAARPSAEEVARRLEAILQLPVPAEARRNPVSLAAPRSVQMQPQVFGMDSSHVEAQPADDKGVTKAGDGKATTVKEVDAGRNSRGDAVSPSNLPSMPVADNPATGLSAPIHHATGAPTVGSKTAIGSQSSSVTAPLQDRLQAQQSLRELGSSAGGGAVNAQIPSGALVGDLDMDEQKGPPEDLGMVGREELEHQSNLQSHPGSVDYSLWASGSAEGPPPNPFAAAAKLNWPMTKSDKE